jgi:hypothetical protein
MGGRVGFPAPADTFLYIFSRRCPKLLCETTGWMRDSTCGVWHRRTQWGHVSKSIWPSAGKLHFDMKHVIAIIQRWLLRDDEKDRKLAKIACWLSGNFLFSRDWWNLVCTPPLQTDKPLTPWHPGRPGILANENRLPARALCRARGENIVHAAVHVGDGQQGQLHNLSLLRVRLLSGWILCWYFLLSKLTLMQHIPERWNECPDIAGWEKPGT